MTFQEAVQELKGLYGIVKEAQGLYEAGTVGYTEGIDDLDGISCATWEDEYSTRCRELAKEVGADIEDLMDAAEGRA